jgi:hypothetical protein
MRHDTKEFLYAFRFRLPCSAVIHVCVYSLFMCLIKKHKNWKSEETYSTTKPTGHGRKWLAFKSNNPLEQIKH